MVDQPKIGVVLPYSESFGILKSGAVALCARDFASWSRFREFDNDHRRGTLRILRRAISAHRGLAAMVDARTQSLRTRDRARRAVEGFAVLEIQNRPSMVEEIRRRLPRIKLALHLHNDPQTMAGSRSPRRPREAAAQVDAVYCVSEFIARRFLQGYGTMRGKTIVVYNGIVGRSSHRAQGADHRVRRPSDPDQRGRRAGQGLRARGAGFARMETGDRGRRCRGIIERPPRPSGARTRSFGGAARH